MFDPGTWRIGEVQIGTKCEVNADFSNANCRPDVFHVHASLSILPAIGSPGSPGRRSSLAGRNARYESAIKTFELC
jgi:hypothetical protein